MHDKKHLSFSGLRSVLSEKARSLPDIRQEGKVRYRIHDSVMCGFAAMYFQDPSLLQFQRRMEDARQTSNMKSLFHIDDIPGDKQIREVSDEIDPASLEEVFTEYFSRLQRGKHLESYRVLGAYYAVVIDGGEYFSSEKLHCPGCLQRNKRFLHQIVQAALIHPDKSQIVPLAPEAVKNTDGREKQDCEISAGKRLIKKIRKTHPKLPLIIIGDSLYSKQPFVQDAGKEAMRFVLVAKETDHEVLMQYVDGARRLGGLTRMETKDHKGRLHVYRMDQ